jgi:hypothetical protein
MARLALGEWKPDLDDNLSASTRTVLNVVPRVDGYGPFPDLSAFTSALPGACRGYAYARNPDGSVSLFAGTSTKLYRLNNTDFTWVDVSKGGSAYTGLPGTDQWQFVQFNNLFFVTQINAPLQVFNLASPATFVDALGSPPQARYITVVGRFLVLSGISGQAYRVQWSGLNNVNASTSWDNLTAQSNFQDLADGGLVRGVAGGEYGLITQDAALRRMTYAPGNPIIFQIDRISEEKGIYAPLSLTRSGDRIFWVGVDGFKMLIPGGYPTPIGKGKVDTTFFADVDTNNLQLCIGASDPTDTRWFLAYKSKAGQAGLFDKLICYDWALNKFTPIMTTGEYLATLAKPGLTLENLDAIAPGALTITGAASNGGPNLIRLAVASTATLTTGQIKAISGIVGTVEANGNWTITVIDATHFDLQGSVFTNAYVSGGIVGGSLDALPFSLDDISASAFAKISAFNSSHKLGFFSGSNLEASVETAEEGVDGQRIRLNGGFAPITDAPVVYGSVSTRSNLQVNAVYGTESLVNSVGICPQRGDTRYARMRSRIPYGTVWTYIEAVVPQFGKAGSR